MHSNAARYGGQCVRKAPWRECLNTSMRCRQGECVGRLWYCCAMCFGVFLDLYVGMWVCCVKGVHAPYISLAN